MNPTSNTRLPTLVEATISLASLIVGIGLSVAVYGLHPQVPLLLGVGVSGLVAWRCGYDWKAIEKAMIAGITRAVPAIMIFLLIGILIGVWILSGVVPTMLYYGLQLLSPDIFLPTTLLICAVTSVATGSSWGASGTIGVALMGVGSALGFPLPVVAGAVISGAYFGDKMSPLSDTTNLASSMAGTDLYTHIRHMFNTTSIAFGLTLLIEIGLGFKYSVNSASDSNVAQILQLFDTQFVINPIMLIPPIILITASFKKVPPLPSLALGIVAAAMLGFIFQGASLKHVLEVAFEGYRAATGVAAVDTLLSRGGITSMYYTISLVLAAMMFGGIMEFTNQLKVLIAKLVEKAQSTASLVAATVFTTIAANIVLCEQYMSIIVGARTYAEEFEKRGLDPKNLSRIVEDAGTTTANLIPWTSGAAYQAGVLGVATIAYAPFAFFCWLSPLVTLVFGIFDINMTRLDKHPENRHLEKDSKSK